MELYNRRLRIEALSTNREWTNILDRWVLNVVNGMPRAAADAKAGLECREKNIPEHIVESLGRIWDEPQPATAPRPAIRDQRTSAMMTFLRAKYPHVAQAALMQCVLRYAALGMNGQQWASAPAFYDDLRRRGVTVEAFASPFNHGLDRYYSVFAEDAVFGSLGSIWSADPTALAREVVYANPPFTPWMLERTADLIVGLPRVIAVTPTWRDAPWYQRLESSGLHVTRNHDTEYQLLGRVFTPRFETSVWTRGLPP